MKLPSDQIMRQAVAARDPSYDGRFFYGVLTTGVFCRPSCGARAARPEHLSFYLTGQDAEKAGFRACKRCKPQVDWRGEVERIARLIQSRPEEAFSLADLSQQSALSENQLRRHFQQTFGLTPKQFQTAQRRRSFKASLKSGAGVTQSIQDAGFGSASRVYEATQQLGMSPSHYAKGGHQMGISHVLRKTTLGWLLIAATDRGVCFAQFGESRSALRQALAKEFPSAHHAPMEKTQSTALQNWIDALEDFLAGTAPLPENVPLDLYGTAFQHKVWRFLTQLPSGKTVSYGALAKDIGHPNAVRAAASACAANRVALLVPCHRVLRSDGGLGGYRWGPMRKQKLLELESDQAQQQPLTPT